MEILLTRHGQTDGIFIKNVIYYCSINKSSKDNKEDYAYYQRITKFDFNEIYESNLLRKIGRVMNSY